MTAEPSARAQIRTVNPATNVPIARYEPFDEKDITRAIADSGAAQQDWSARAHADRATAVTSAAEILRERRAEFARLITSEMGKPVAESVAEIEKCAVACDFYAAHSAGFLADEAVETSADRSWVGYEPLGTVLAVMPWNFPFWQVFRCAVPALMAGNSVLLKHAPNTTGCALAVEALLRDAGLPAGLFTALLIAEADVPEVIERLIGDPGVSAVTVTGSERTGSSVAAAAGRAIKKSVLELGGSDPFIVLADADLPPTVAMAARSRFLNGGQSCIAAKRFIVEAAVATAFTQMLVAAVEALVVGDPMQEDTDVGPMAREDLLDDLDRQVRASVATGAALLVGGRRMDRAGWFYQPTVVTDVRPGMPLYDEETFGPVAAVVVVDDADHAVRVANDTRYGLAMSVWTADLTVGEALARRVHSGAVFVNAVVATDVRMPFGGTRHSGYGRELAAAGIREFVNTRSWWSMRVPAGGAAPSTE